MVQTPPLEASIVNVTGSPEDAVEVNVIDCTLFGAALTENDCATSGAGAYVESPPWSARIVHVPAPTNETVEPEIVQTPLLAGAIENVTARPEVAEAATVYVAPPTTTPTGGVDVELIVCG